MKRSNNEVNNKIETNIESQSNSERRINEAFDDLPDPFPSNREFDQWTQFSRHVTALRFRLDYLTRLEDRDGPNQKHVHRNRAERNALCWILAERLQSEKPTKPNKINQKADPRYIDNRMTEIEELIVDGYYIVKRERPGLVYHKLGDDIAPMQVSLPVWFYLLGQSSRER